MNKNPIPRDDRYQGVMKSHLDSQTGCSCGQYALFRDRADDV